MRPTLRLCIFLALFALLPTLPGQTASKPDPYAAESIVILHADTLYSFAPDGTGFRERTIAARIQSDAAVRALGVIAIPYAGNSEQVEILYARVRRPDGTVVNTDPADALEMPEEVTRAAPFYSDLKQKQLPIRSLRVGDTLEWKARITRTKAEAPGQFWGQESLDEDAVTLSQTVELRVPKSSSVTVWSPTSKPTESTDGDQHIYRWSASQLKPTAGKEAEAEPEAKKKEVWTADQELDAEQGKLPTIAWTTFKSWEDVGAWYRGLEAGRTDPTPEIKAKAAELTAGESTDEEKVRALYAYVATQFRYIGVAFGVGRYQPHTANQIMENQYGDCKDKHTVLAALLAASGFHADAVLIGAGIRFNAAVPSPAAFNHLITRLTVANQPVWLDATAEIAPYRVLLAPIRDKQALIIPDTATAHVDRTPADLPFPAKVTWDSTGSLDKDGTSHSHIVFTLRGDDEIIYRNAIHGLSPAQYNQGVQRMANALGYAGTTSNAEISPPEDTAEPLKISFDYEREKGGDWANYRTLPQLLPVVLPRFADKDPLVRALNLGSPRIEISSSSMKLPEGWGAELPEAIHLKTPFITLDVTYHFEKGTLSAERRIQVLQRKVPTADLKTYKKFADDGDIGNEPFIQLTLHTYLGDPVSKDHTKASSNAPSAAVDSGDATKLIHAATTLAQQGDLEAATESLDQAKAIDPGRESLWAMYGAVAMQRGDPLEAIDDYKKEIKLHPSTLIAYPALVDAQQRLSERKEVMATLHDWAAADPSDPTPTAQLLSMQLEEGDAKAAIVSAESALAHLPEDPKKTAAIKVGLGRAQIMTGSIAKGTATIHAALKNAEDPSDLNAGAHALADASLDLPLAESSARAALDKLTQESNTWTLDENPQTLHLRNQLIIDTWATLGWVLTRERKFDEGLGYLKAASRGDQNAETLAHIGDLEIARGDKRAALAAFELALAKVPAYDGMGVRRPPGPLERRVQSQADALIKAGIPSSVGTDQDPYRQLDLLRMIRIDLSHPPETNVQYRLLIKDGKVAKIESGGNQIPLDKSGPVANVELSDLWPPGSRVALVRFAYLYCHSASCSLALQP